MDGHLMESIFLSVKASALFNKQIGGREAVEAGVDMQSLVVKVRDFRPTGESL
jgi:hypothetical protein